MNRIFIGGVAVGMAWVVSGELIKKGLEPSVGPSNVHVSEQDFSPFGMPSPYTFIVSGQYSIPNTISANRPFRMTVGGEWNDPYDF